MTRTLVGARIVTRDDVLEDGTVTLAEDGTIADVRIGGGDKTSEDLRGDYLLPGLVDIHTDNLERQYFPRPGVDWDPVSASIIHDGNCVSTGVTTIFDSLSIGSWSGKEARRMENMQRLIDGLAEADEAGLLNATHFIHWRCETTNPFLPELFGAVADHRMTRLLSIMDHTPGQRQYPDLEKHLAKWQEHAGLTEEEARKRYNELVAHQKDHAAPNREAIASYAKKTNLALASHDDQLTEHVDDARTVGVGISEFPTTLAAAQRAREHGMDIAMGAPNLMRGGSYSGNVSAGELAQNGLLDIFASDYVPRSMIEAAFRLTEAPYNWPLHRSVALVSHNPASSVGLKDRGSIEAGLRADLIRVRLVHGHPVVVAVWTAGQRVS